jgi:hypothetical protein
LSMMSRVILGVVVASWASDGRVGAGLLGDALVRRCWCVKEMQRLVDEEVRGVNFSNLYSPFVNMQPEDFDQREMW